MSCNEAAIVRACKAGGDVEQVASDCGVASHGPLNIGPFRQIGSRAATCARLFALEPNEQNGKLFASMDAKMRGFLEYVLNMRDQPDEQLRYFTGEMVDCLFALIYLLRKPHIKSKACLILQPLKTALRNYRASEAPLEWSDFAVTWEFSDSANGFVLSVPGHDLSIYLDKINKCLRRKRFFFSLVALLGKPSVQNDATVMILGHASLLFYDKQTGLLERFDPYQSGTKAFETEQLDQQLSQKFATLLGFRRFVGPPNLSPTERRGLQYREKETSEAFATDPQGFCVPWSVLYAESRITSPLQNPESIPQLLAVWAAKNTRSLSSVIRLYTRKIEQLKQAAHAKFLANEHEHANETAFLYATVLELLIDQG